MCGVMVGCVVCEGYAFFNKKFTSTLYLLVMTLGTGWDVNHFPD